MTGFDFIEIFISIIIYAPFSIIKTSIPKQAIRALAHSLKPTL